MPAGDVVAGAVNTRHPAPVSDKPEPLSVMTILPLAATSVTGLSVRLMAMEVAPLATLLRAMAGSLTPRSYTELPEIITNEPVAVVSRTEGVEADTSNEVPAARMLDAS